MLPLPWRDETLALRLDDVASALDAGLGADQILSGPATAAWRGTPPPTGGSLVDALIAKGAPLAPHERTTLEAAERGGRLPAALRNRAEARRVRAGLVRDVVARLRYPAFLILLATLVFGFVDMLAGRSPIRGAIILLTPAILFLIIVLVWRKLRSDPGWSGRHVPGLRPLLQDIGELPYLETLQGLYGAGVSLVEAHQEALRTVPVAFVRARLVAAGTRLDAGGPLAESLAGAGALGVETMQIIVPAEQSGTLEEALERAYHRRRHTLNNRLAMAARLLAGIVTALVMLFIALWILEFYLGMYSGIRRR